MLVGDRSRPVLEGNPYIDTLESFPEKWWFNKEFSEIAKMTWRLRLKPKDALIILHASPLIHLWGFLIGAPIRAGFDENGSGFSLTHMVTRTRKDYDRYLGDVNLDLARVFGIENEDSQLDLFLSDDELLEVHRFLPSTSGIEPISRLFLIGIAPGGGQNAFESTSAKHWPASHYAALMIELAKQHNIQFLLLGDNGDVQIDEIGQKAAGRASFLNLKGKTTFRELAAIIHHLDVLITNDSSPLHIAAALHKPVVALFGPTANWALSPPGHNKIALQSSARCSPCYTFGRFPGCSKSTCMLELSVETVKDAVESILTSC